MSRTFRPSALKLLAAAAALPLLCATAAHAAVATLAPLTTFGTNGWLAPGSSSFLGTANNERGLAYGNGHVYLVSRTGGTNVRILNPTTGADLGGLNVTGISGGTFAVNAAGVGSDGTIYVANLTTNSTTSAFKVYSWANESSTPTTAYSGNGGLAGARVGDSFAVTGSGANTRIAAGYGSSPAVAGNNSYAILDPTASSASAIAFTGTPPNAGDFRLGISFGQDANHVLGDQGITGVLYRYTSYAGAAGTLLASPANSSVSPPINNTGERMIAYDSVAGVPLIAMQSIGDSHVSIYDASDPANPVYVTSGDNTTGTLTANGNGTGQIAWGPATDNGDGTFSATLYAMSTNQGIQAFVVTVPEPASFAACGFALLPTLTRRRRRA